MVILGPMTCKQFLHAGLIRLPLFFLLILPPGTIHIRLPAPRGRSGGRRPTAESCIHTTCKGTLNWYPFANNRGHTAYLTLNVSDPSNSTNSGEWHPVITQAGYYQVEAYIAGHSPITWCTGSNRDHQPRHDRGRIMSSITLTAYPSER